VLCWLFFVVLLVMNVNGFCVIMYIVLWDWLV